MGKKSLGVFTSGIGLVFSGFLRRSLLRGRIWLNGVIFSVELNRTNSGVADFYHWLFHGMFATEFIQADLATLMGISARVLNIIIPPMGWLALLGIVFLQIVLGSWGTKFMRLAGEQG